MQPINYSIKKGVTHFHYKGSELMDFVRRGLKDGNVGFILVRRQQSIFTYRGFGTIESPSRSIITISIMHNTLFSGEMKTDEEIVNPKKSSAKIEGRIVILDLSEIKEVKLKK